MQLSLRASLVSTAVPARRCGWASIARARANCSGCSPTRTIAPRRDEHVLDSFQGFLRRSGIERGPLEWNLPLPHERAAVRRSADSRRAADADHQSLLEPSRRATGAPSATRRSPITRCEAHGMRVILCGGRSALEREMGARDRARRRGVPLDQSDRRATPCRSCWRCWRAPACCCRPDSGPAHMATMVGTPVIGLYAATRLQRSGPYLSRQWCVDRYEAGGAPLPRPQRRAAALAREDRAARRHGSDRGRRRARAARCAAWPR